MWYHVELKLNLLKSDKLASMQISVLEPQAEHALRVLKIYFVQLHLFDNLNFMFKISSGTIKSFDFHGTLSYRRL